jgi:hypothetical protein
MLIAVRNRVGICGISFLYTGYPNPGTGLLVEATFFAIDGSFDTLSIAQQNINFQVIEALVKESIQLSEPVQAMRLTLNHGN